MINNTDEILFLKPIMKEVLWGGTRLRDEYHYDIPSDHTGECWAVSAHEHGDCEIISGKYQGVTLSTLWNTNRELFGNRKEDKFPLLVKIIDAKADLSIQVHPNDEYAKLYENGSLGKTECWYILDCDADATIVIGHNASNKEELIEMIEQNRWNELIRCIPIKKGDFFQINPGTVHAIKAGTLILETQQNSDITYRVYDYNRLTNGQPRELHIAKSEDVIIAPYVDNVADTMERSIQNMEGFTKELLVTCPYYTVETLEVETQAKLNQTHAFQIFSVIEGNGKINGIDKIGSAHV